MGRKKKDTNSRKKQLVDAATKLFFSKGYTDTSVRDILNETNDRTASPFWPAERQKNNPRPLLIFQLFFTTFADTS